MKTSILRSVPSWRHIIPAGLLLGMLLLFSHCEHEEDFNVNNLNHNIIMILGHRGMGEYFKYPGNTMESIGPVIEIGADGAELDVHLSKDSVLVLFHDQKLDTKTNCSGDIYEYNYADIADCEYHAVKDGIRLNTVDQVFSSLPEVTELYFSFDCKLHPDYTYSEIYRRQFLGAIKLVCEKYDMSDQVFIEGDLHFLLLAKEMGLTNKGFLIGSSVDEAITNQIFGIGTSVNSSAEEIKYAHDHGIYVMMWGAKSDLGNKQAIRLNPDILQTDKPIPLLMLFNRMNYDYTIP